MTFYRVIMVLLVPVLLIRALIRGEGRTDLAERLGRGGTSPVGLWLHGASLGELASARWLIAAMLDARPGLTVLVTANTVTGRQRVRDWGLQRVTARLAPLDLGFVLRRFLDRWQPKALITLEAEFWPLRFDQCAARSVPVLLLGARMSDRSARRWQKRPRLAGAMLNRVSLASAQDAVSRRHLALLGLAAAVTLPDMDLKAQAFAHLPPAVAPPRHLRSGWLLAASTHEGDEALILRAFAGQDRFTQLILAPRHPARAAQIVADLQRTKLAFDRRSIGADPGRAPVFLADTLGEMELWYTRCGAVVVGGTFAAKGGHSPWEPMRHGCAILHGGDTGNFAAPFAALDQAGGALLVTPETLAATLQALDDDAQDRLAGTAQSVLQAQGDVSALLARILAVSGL